MFLPESHWNSILYSVLLCTLPSLMLDSVVDLYLHMCARSTVEKEQWYRWVPLKPDFLGACKSVWLINYLAYQY